MLKKSLKAKSQNKSRMDLRKRSSPVQRISESIVRLRWPILLVWMLFLGWLWNGGQDWLSGFYGFAELATQWFMNHWQTTQSPLDFVVALYENELAQAKWIVASLGVFFLGGMGYAIWRAESKWQPPLMVLGPVAWCAAVIGLNGSQEVIFQILGVVGFIALLTTLLGKHAVFLWVAPALLAVVGAMGVANWIWSTQMPESLDIFSLFGWMFVIGLMIGKAGLIYVNAAVAIGKGAGKMGAIAKALEASMKHWGVVFIATMAWLAVLLHPYFQADFESVVRSIYSVLALGIFVWLVWPAILSLFPLQRFSPKKSKK